MTLRRTAESSLIPRALREQGRWVRWAMAEVGPPGRRRWTKKPAGSLLDPDVPRPFDEVARDELTPRGGVGFCFTGRVRVPGGWLVALDVDACRDPQTGAVADWALHVVRDLGRGSYAEVSPSGTGLRQFLVVRKQPEHIGRARDDEPPPPLVDKRPGVEFYGLSGGAQYVTVTGAQLPGTSADVLAVDDLSELARELGADQRNGHSGEAGLPRGSGKPPTPEEAAAAVRRAPRGDALLRGDWATLGAESASEAFYELELLALRACRNHGAAALDLIMRSAWGAGLVDSREPGRYTRRDWVARDLARASGKAGAAQPSEVFTPVEVPPPAPQDEWLATPAEARARSRGCRWLAHGLLQRSGVAQVFGDPSSGKTPLAVSLALHVAAGLPRWFGHELDDRGPVLYMVGEDLSGMLDRIAAQAKALGVPEDGILVTLRPAALVRPEERAEWQRRAVERLGGRPPVLVVVDTQARNFGPGNENSTEDMAAFVDAVDAMRRELGCLVLLVHHTGHQNKDRGRGSSALPAALDAQLEVRREGDLVTATVTKLKHAATPRPIRARLEAVQVGTDEKGRPVTAVTVAPASAAAARPDDLGPALLAVLAAVRDSAGEPVGQRGLAELAGTNKKAAAAAAADLERLGLVEVREDGDRGRSRYLLTDSGRRTCPAGAAGTSREPVGTSLAHLLGEEAVSPKNQSNETGLNMTGSSGEEPRGTSQERIDVNDE